MQTPEKTKQSRRVKKRPKKYAPTEVIRDRSTGSKKRARRHNSPVVSQKQIPFKPASMSARRDSKQAVLSQSCRTRLMLLRGAKNTSPGLVVMMNNAVAVVNDFGDSVKVEFPRFKCLSCQQYFSLQGYRKVRAIATQCMYNNNMYNLHECRTISELIYKKTNVSKRARCQGG